MDGELVSILTRRFREKCQIKLLTLISVGQVDWPRSAEYLLKVLALTRLRVEELLVGTAHLALFAIIAHVVRGTIGVVRHEVGAKRLAVGGAICIPASVTARRLVSGGQRLD